MKTIVCALAIVGAFVLAALHVVEGPDALTFAQWVLGIWTAGMTLATTATKIADAFGPFRGVRPEPVAVPTAVKVAATCLALVLLACTPSERATAATVAQGVVLACDAGMRLAAAPELEPLCADIPEVEAAIAEIVAEHTTPPPVDAGAPAPLLAEVHRRVHRHRHRHHDAGTP